MKKPDIIFNLSKNFILPKADAKVCVNTILEAITAAITTGDGVEVRGFGSFYKKHRKVRVGFNPRTGERTEVAEKFVPFFKPSKSLREVVNKN